MCGIVAFGIYGQAAESRSLDSQVASLQQTNSALQRQISEEQQQVVEAQTYAWLVEEARKLGYVFSGEHIFVLTGPGAPAQAQGGVQAPLPTFQPPTPMPTPTPKHTPTPAPTPLHLGVVSPSPTATG